MNFGIRVLTNLLLKYDGQIQREINNESYVIQYYLIFIIGHYESYCKTYIMCVSYLFLNWIIQFEQQIKEDLYPKFW